METEKYNLFKPWVDDFPLYLLQNESQQYGCPDCRDQGTIFIQFKQGNLIRNWFINPDTHMLPADLKDYISRVHEAFKQID